MSQPKRFGVYRIRDPRPVIAVAFPTTMPRSTLARATSGAQTRIGNIAAIIATTCCAESSPSAKLSVSFQKLK
jgi:hypothetical protein